MRLATNRAERGVIREADVAHGHLRTFLDSQGLLQTSAMRLKMKALRQADRHTRNYRTSDRQHVHDRLLLGHECNRGEGREEEV